MGLSRLVRIRLLTVALLGLLFGAGFMAGIAADRRLLAARPDTTVTEPRSAERERRDGRSLIIDRVDLTPEQKLRVDSIVEHHRKRLAELQGEFRPRYREIVNETRLEIKAVLTAEQAAAYDSLLDERRRRSRDGGDDRSEPPGERSRR